MGFSGNRCRSASSSAAECSIAEIVHHVDWNPFNNDPDNLVILTRSEHQRLHACFARKRWAAEEKARARELRLAGMTIQEIAMALPRPFSSTSRFLAKFAKESRLATAFR